MFFKLKIQSSNFYTLRNSLICPFFFNDTCSNIITNFSIHYKKNINQRQKLKTELFSSQISFLTCCKFASDLNLERSLSKTGSIEIFCLWLNFSPQFFFINFFFKNSIIRHKFFRRKICLYENTISETDFFMLKF